MPHALTVQPRGLGAVCGGVVAALALVLGPLASPASADVFINSDDPCPVPADDAPFTDRDEINDSHVLTADCAYELGIIEGSPTEDGVEFMAKAPTRRDWMASFIVRTLRAGGIDVPEAEDQGFSDVDNDNVHQENIQILAAMNVTQGVSEGTYNPDGTATRAQMASFLTRAARFAYEGADGPGFEAQTDAGFSDVSEDSVHAEAIDAAAQVVGLTNGIGEGQYGPGRPTSRQEMATFLIRLLDFSYEEIQPQ